jgi:hypothetical protein
MLSRLPGEIRTMAPSNNAVSSLSNIPAAILRYSVTTPPRLLQVTLTRLRQDPGITGVALPTEPPTPVRKRTTPMPGLLRFPDRLASHFSAAMYFHRHAHSYQVEHACLKTVLFDTALACGREAATLVHLITE